MGLGVKDWLNLGLRLFVGALRRNVNHLRLDDLTNSQQRASVSKPPDWLAHAATGCIVAFDFESGSGVALCPLKSE